MGSVRFPVTTVSVQANKWILSIENRQGEDEDDGHRTKKLRVPAVAREEQGVLSCGS